MFLPSDTIQQILFSLPPQDLFSLQRVCKQWRHAIHHAPPNLFANYYCNFYLKNILSSSSSAVTTTNSSSPQSTLQQQQILNYRIKYNLDNSGNTEDAAIYEAELRQNQQQSIYLLQPPTAFEQFFGEEANRSAPRRELHQQVQILAQEFKIPHLRQEYEENAASYQAEFQEVVKKYKLTLFGEAGEAAAAAPAPTQTTMTAGEEDASLLGFWRGLVLQRAKDHATHVKTVNSALAGIGEAEKQAERERIEAVLQQQLPAFLSSQLAAVNLLKMSFINHSNCSLSFSLYGATGARMIVTVTQSDKPANSYRVYLNGSRLFAMQEHISYLPFQRFCNLLFGEARGKTRLALHNVQLNLMNCLNVYKEHQSVQWSTEDIPPFYLFRRDPRDDVEAILEQPNEIELQMEQEDCF